MAKQFLKRWSPNADKIQKYRILRVFGGLLRYDYLWKLQRGGAARGIAVGLFCCWMPVPFQMPLAAGGAILFRGYLPASMATVWLTNPVTMAPAMVIAYKIGQIILGDETAGLQFEFSYEWLRTIFPTIWKPLMVGCLLLGSASAGLGYFIVMETWRLSVMRRWRRRKHKWGQWRAARQARKAAGLSTEVATEQEVTPDLSIMWADLVRGDCVRILSILDPTVMVPNRFDQRQPSVGDVVEVVGIHSEPTQGFELRCENADGDTIWHRAVAPDDLVIEKVLD